MDPKASAKSKRSHTQHARKVHAPAAAIAHKKKAAAERATAHPHRSSLPSNWDRYDDGSSEETSGKQQTGDGEVAPKSKGADFGYLMEQARSQPKDFSSSSVDALSLEFMQGFSSMLSVRGKGLVSLCEDDNFVVDDDPTSCFEIPFLSLDLNALSAQLSKLKLSQRLSIEAYLLPEELGIEEPDKNSALKAPETPEPAQLDSTSSPISSHNTNQSTEQGSSKSPEQLGRSSRSLVESDTFSDSKLNKNQRFEVAAAEAELDMLLGSLTEAASKSSNIHPSDPLNGQSMSQPLISFRDVPGTSSGNVAVTSIDDSIDDLLAETSLCLGDQGSKSKNAYVTTSTRVMAADSIDDLLAETSAPLIDQKSRTITSSTGLSLQTHSTVSKAADEFDSWLDSL